METVKDVGGKDKHEEGREWSQSEKIGGMRQ